VECFRKLISNPTFKDVMVFAPEMAFADANGKNQIYDNMWMADRWWDTQVILLMLPK
jgi:hypothetical protein